MTAVEGSAPGFQRCPNCGREHDVRVYVSGQRAPCSCGIHFEVRRSSSGIGRAAQESGLPPTLVRKPTGAPEPATVEKNGGEAPPTPPVEIPGYHLRELLGRGGMGEVWRAEQVSLGRMVAIKVLPPRLAQDPEFVARFGKEATALASLNHPNIVQIIDRGIAGEHYYFVMEYVVGRTLRDEIRLGPLPEEETLKIGAQLCRAVDYAHDRHIVHRDLKPENILLDERGYVKVADFGLANFIAQEADARLTATAVAMGTVNYMAPEQRRDAAMVDGRADIYSIGVLLYEMLTGQLPLGRFKAPSEHQPGVDARLDAVVLKALETDPEARYARASILGETLDRLLAESNVGASALGSSPRAQAETQSRSGRVVLGLIAAAVLLALGAFAFHALSPPPNDGHDHAGAGHWPPNTDHAIGVAVTESKSRGQLLIETSFEPGDEVINAHAGHWHLREGKLKATQAGTDSGGQPILAPRAYLGRRYFSSDDFHVETEVTLRSLEKDFPIDPEGQRYAELSFRVKDLQVSVLAIPQSGMRFAWRYFRRGGQSVVGNSSDDVQHGVSEEAPFPGFQRTFRMGLTLKRVGDGVTAEGLVDGVVFFRKHLDGLQGHAAKVALGCRDMHCEFDNLKAWGRPATAGEGLHGEEGSEPPAAGLRTH